MIRELAPLTRIRPRRTQTVTHAELLTLRRNLAGGSLPGDVAIPPERAQARGRQGAAASASRHGLRGTRTARLSAGARRVRSRLLVGGSAAAGTGLGLAFAVTALLRRSKPLHPVGAVATARLTVAPATTSSGSRVLDDPGEYDCLVRASYAVGTGPRYADIEGFALRLLHAGADADAVADAGADAAMADVLFASTGVGPLGRHVLTVRSPGVHATQTTLLPVQAARRALYLRLDPLDAGARPWPTHYRLSWAHGRGAWHPVGALTVAWGTPVDAAERFDPVAHPLPGTSQYRAVAWLREPAYRMARLAWPRAGRLPAAKALRTRR